jgi:hypothetical protein
LFGLHALPIAKNVQTKDLAVKISKQRTYGTASVLGASYGFGCGWLFVMSSYLSMTNRGIDHAKNCGGYKMPVPEWARADVTVLGR